MGYRLELSTKKIIIANHVYATAFPQHLEEYLLTEKVGKLLSIRHPLHPDEENFGSHYLLFQQGKLKEKQQAKKIFGFNLLRYLHDVWYDFWCVVKTGGKWDLYFGSNNLNTLAGICLKKLGKVKKVVFYTVDFVPFRFENKLLNRIYHWVDKFGVINADETWILSPRMRDGRKKYYGLDSKYDKKQILVPEGVWVDRIVKPEFEKIDKHTAVYVGHLSERMGVQVVIKAIPYILKEIKDFRFIVIGKGDYRPQLERLADELKIKDRVKFTGFIENHKEVENIIACCGVGVATYEENESSLTFYAEPAKTKLYLGAGLPVVMTNSFYNAKDIEKAAAGKIVGYNSAEVAKAIFAIIQDEESLKQYRINAEHFARRYAYPDLFIQHLNRVL